MVVEFTSVAYAPLHSRLHVTTNAKAPKSWCVQITYLLDVFSFAFQDVLKSDTI
jgi:hypothetical protein